MTHDHGRTPCPAPVVTVVIAPRAGRREGHRAAAEIRLHGQHEQRVAVVARARDHLCAPGHDGLGEVDQAFDTRTGQAHTIGLLVLTLSGGRISAMTRFDSGVLGRFGLPVTIAR